MKVGGKGYYDMRNYGGKAYYGGKGNYGGKGYYHSSNGHYSGKVNYMVRDGAKYGGELRRPRGGKENYGRKISGQTRLFQ